MKELTIAEYWTDVEVINPVTRERKTLSIYVNVDRDIAFGIDQDWMLDEEPQIVSMPHGERVELVDEIN